MGQTKYCWEHGPGAWMHHKDLPLPDSLILLQNKLSLHCFDSVPRLSCSLSPTQTWLAGLGSRCIPGPAYRIQHVLNFSSVFLLQDLVLFACFPLQLFPHPLLHSCIFPSKASTVLPSSAVLSSTLFSSTNPKTACTPVLLLLQWCLLSTVTPVPTSNSAPESALFFPNSVIFSYLMYFLFQNYSCSFSILAVVHPWQLWGPGLPTVVQAQGSWQSCSGFY